MAGEGVTTAGVSTLAHRNPWKQAFHGASVDNRTVVPLSARRPKRRPPRSGTCYAPAMAGKSSRNERRGRKEPKPPHPAAVAAAEHRHDDAGPDRIVCLLCGRDFRAINSFHLRAAHGFQGAHPVEDYKAQFGLRVASCQEFCDRAREVQIDYHTREGRHLERDDVLDRIRKLARRGRPLARTRVPHGLSFTGIRIFGTWDDALRAAGEDPLDHRLLGGWTREDILDRIRLVAGDPPLTDKRAFEEHQRLYNLAMGEFGAWSKALKAAGIRAPRYRKKTRWSLEKAESWVRKRHAAGERIRTQDAPSGAVGHVARGTGMGWVAFVESLGVPYPRARQTRSWTGADVIKRIRERQASGAALNCKHVLKDGEGALLSQAYARFGSWDAALTAAGIDPATVRLKRPWSRDDVMEAIRDRQARGLPLDWASVTKSDRRIVVAASKLWPKPRPWARALRSAGVDPGAPKGGRAGGQRRQ